ncbi:hypothetical protein COLO4_25442 [Corchorus olitorius]|uniref:Uncharacterized protein n=1 Tax=Corchorus olitorius TaxID=93759 RepID=A0A1R3I2L2_9ROSI|nr:hypothetical protein COLO4_25442 [Corchorus olitorius]
MAKGPMNTKNQGRPNKNHVTKTNNVKCTDST